jgi:hypothetical protein
MTKLLTVRVVVPCDDKVTADDLSVAIRLALEPIGMAFANGKDGPRIHWAAIDVLRSVQRTPPPRPSRKKAASP